FYDPQVKAEAASVEVRTAGVAHSVGQTLADRLGARSFTVTTVSSGQTARSGVFVRTGAKRYTANELARQLGGLPVDALPVGERVPHGLEARQGGAAVLRHRPAELGIGRLPPRGLAVGERRVEHAGDASDGVRGPGGGAPRPLLLLCGHALVPVYTGVSHER